MGIRSVQNTSTLTAEGPRFGVGRNKLRFGTQLGGQVVDPLMAEDIGRLSTGDNDPACVRFDRVVELALDFTESWNKSAATLCFAGWPIWQRSRRAT